MTKPRYEIRERMVSPKGEGDFPKYEDKSYIVWDNKERKEVNAVSTREAAEQRIETRKKYNRRRKRLRVEEDR